MSTTTSHTTMVVDLADISLDDLRIRDDRLETHVETLFRQVARPRTNLGNSGPPGHTY